MTAINLTVGLCTGGVVQSETVTSLFGALDVIKGHGIGVNLSLQIGGYVAHNRNELVRVAQKNGSTHLMFIDADMIFQPSSIQRLIDHDKDVVGANYNARGVPGQPIISTLKLVDPSTDPDKGKFIQSEFSAQLFPVFGLATGFMLIKMPVFDKVEAPWFVAYEEPNGEHHTEDIEFCAKCHKVGIDVYCSPTIQIGHKGNYVY
jgi:GT2 family glycosyltransferase